MKRPLFLDITPFQKLQIFYMIGKIIHMSLNDTFRNLNLTKKIILDLKGLYFS
jgi:hypothetical protein